MRLKCKFGRDVVSAMIEEPLLFIGTYTQRMPSESEGIYVYKFNSAIGELMPVYTQSGIENPSYLAIDTARGYLYSVSEIIDEGKAPQGAVSAFKVDRETGGLTFLNQQSSQGRGPCYVWVDSSGQCVLVANYGSGNIAALPVRAGSGLEKADRKSTRLNSSHVKTSYA